jgi:hypothetical protein
MSDASAPLKIDLTGTTEFQAAVVDIENPLISNVLMSGFQH